MSDDKGTPRDSFDCTPQQYHAGLDKLWTAIGLKGVQDEDVFTLAARRIQQGDRLAQAAGAFLHEYHRYADDNLPIAFVPPAGMTTELALALSALSA